MGRRVSLVGVAVAVLAVVPPLSGRAQADLLIAAAPLPSQQLASQLDLANTGGKSICGASMTSDGAAAFYAVHLPSSAQGPDRTGLYRRDLGTGAETLLMEPSADVPVGCGVTSGDGALYAFIA